MTGPRFVFEIGCPRCGAGPWEWCRTGNHGKPFRETAVPHAARWDEAYRAELALRAEVDRQVRADDEVRKAKSEGSR